MCRGICGQTGMPGPPWAEHLLTAEFQAGGNEPPGNVHSANDCHEGLLQHTAKWGGTLGSGGDAGRQRLSGERVVRRGRAQTERLELGSPHCSWAGAGQAQCPGASGREPVRLWVLRPRPFGRGPWPPGCGQGGREACPLPLSLSFPQMKLPASVRDCSLTLTTAQIATQLEWASFPVHSHYTNRYPLGWGIGSAAGSDPTLITDSG